MDTRGKQGVLPCVYNRLAANLVYRALVGMIGGVFASRNTQRSIFHNPNTLTFSSRRQLRISAYHSFVERQVDIFSLR